MVIASVSGWSVEAGRSAGNARRRLVGLERDYVLASGAMQEFHKRLGEAQGSLIAANDYLANMTPQGFDADNVQIGQMLDTLQDDGPEVILISSDSEQDMKKRDAGDVVVISSDNEDIGEAADPASADRAWKRPAAGEE